MKRNVIGFLLLTTLLVTSVRAEDAAPKGNTTESSKPVVATDVKPGLVSSVLAQVMKPVDWTKENVWNAYPRASASAATFIAVWAACRMYKPLGQALFGCKAEKSRERAEYSF